MKKIILFLCVLLLVGCGDLSSIQNTESLLPTEAESLQQLTQDYSAGIDFSDHEVLASYCKPGMYVFVHDDVRDVKEFSESMRSARMDQIEKWREEYPLKLEKMLSETLSPEEIGDAILAIGISYLYNERYRDGTPYIVCAAENYQNTFAMYILGQMYGTPPEDSDTYIPLDFDYEKAGFWIGSAIYIDSLEGFKNTINKKALGVYDWIFEMQLEDDRADIVDDDVERYIVNTFPHYQEIFTRREEREHDVPEEGSEVESKPESKALPKPQLQPISDVYKLNKSMELEDEYNRYDYKPVSEININDIEYFADSTLEADGEFYYGKSNLFDGDWSTSWCAIKGGTFPVVDFVFDEPMYIGWIGIVPGYATDEDIYFKNSRVKELDFDSDTGGGRSFILPDAYKMHYVFVDTYFDKSASLMFGDLYPGSKFDDTCVAEIDFSPSVQPHIATLDLDYEQEDYDEEGGYDCDRGFTVYSEGHVEITKKDPGLIAFLEGVQVGDEFTVEWGAKAEDMNSDYDQVLSVDNVEVQECWQDDRKYITSIFDPSILLDYGLPYNGGLGNFNVTVYKGKKQKFGAKFFSIIK